jgi:radical SAM protein with 4Fe4S-binding SPASM domain
MLQGRASRSLKVLEYEQSFIETMRRLYGELWDLRRFRAIRVRSCGYGNSLTVLSTGMVLPCGINGGVGEQVRVSSLSSIYRKFKEMAGACEVTELRPCRRCDLRFICGGGCRIVHHSVTGSVNRAACTRQDREAYYRRLMLRDEVFFRISGRLDRPARTGT